MNADVGVKLSVLHRASASSKLTTQVPRFDAAGLPEDTASLPAGPEASESISHPVEPRARTAMLPPVLVRFSTRCSSKSKGLT